MNRLDSERQKQSSTHFISFLVDLYLICVGYVCRLDKKFKNAIKELQAKHNHSIVQLD